jgi:hypothetical protein
MYQYNSEKVFGETRTKIERWQEEAAQQRLWQIEQKAQPEALSLPRPVRLKMGRLLIQWGLRLAQG